MFQNLRTAPEVDGRTWAICAGIEADREARVRPCARGF